MPTQARLHQCLAINDNLVLIANQKTRMTICEYFQNVFFCCKYRQQWVSQSLPPFQNKECEKSHHKPCRMFSQFSCCKFERCAYTHDQDVKITAILMTYKIKSLSLRKVSGNSLNPVRMRKK